VFHARISVMQELLIALGLVLAVEGLLSAAFPDAVKQAMLNASATPNDQMRVMGLVGAVIGVVLIWFVKFG
jgi:uncharacterized protein